MFSAFEGAPRIVRLWGTGVYISLSPRVKCNVRLTMHCSVRL